jgi:hypothetical protein
MQRVWGTACVATKSCIALWTSEQCTAPSWQAIHLTPIFLLINFNQVTPQPPKCHPISVQVTFWKDPSAFLHYVSQNNTVFSHYVNCYVSQERTNIIHTLYKSWPPLSCHCCTVVVIVNFVIQVSTSVMQLLIWIQDHPLFLWYVSSQNCSFFNDSDHWYTST